MSEKQLHTYVPSEIKIIFKGVEVRGIKKGTFCKITPGSDTWSMKKSGDGKDTTRVLSEDDSAMVEITVEHGSDTNRQFDDILESDKVNRDGVGAITVKDLNGNDKHTGEAAWIVVAPPGEYGEDGGDRTWKIQVASMETHTRGSVF
jgi:hypothetical protein